MTTGRGPCVGEPKLAECRPAAARTALARSVRPHRRLACRQRRRLARERSRRVSEPPKSHLCQALRTSAGLPNRLAVDTGKGSLRTQLTTASSPKTFPSHPPGHGEAGAAGAALYFRPASVPPHPCSVPGALRCRAAVIAPVSLEALQEEARASGAALSRVLRRPSAVPCTASS